MHALCSRASPASLSPPQHSLALPGSEVGKLKALEAAGVCPAVKAVRSTLQYLTTLFRDSILNNLLSIRFSLQCGDSNSTSGSMYVSLVRLPSPTVLWNGTSSGGKG
jgi:hypothetical protein